MANVRTTPRSGASSSAANIYTIANRRHGSARFCRPRCPSAAHPGALTQFVGREHELGLLRRAWQQSQAGVGQVVIISGEPGIGKSRLLQALSEELSDKAYTRITLGCSPYHTNSAELDSKPGIKERPRP